jgi:hypothetical protein
MLCRDVDKEFRHIGMTIGKTAREKRASDNPLASFRKTKASVGNASFKHIGEVVDNVKILRFV